MRLGYLDVNPNPDNTYGDLLEDKNAIIVGSLANLLKCPEGDRGRIFRPDYYSRLYDLLQEPMGESTSTILRLSLIQSIEKWEPRIELIPGQTGVVPDYSLPGYQVVVAFRFLNSSQVNKANFAVHVGGGSTTN